MRPEKQFLTDEYVEWLNQSPFFIVTEYTGLNVAEFELLRLMLRENAPWMTLVLATTSRLVAVVPLVTVLALATALNPAASLFLALAPVGRREAHGAERLLPTRDRFSCLRLCPCTCGCSGS